MNFLFDYLLIKKDTSYHILEELKNPDEANNFEIRIKQNNSKSYKVIAFTALLVTLFISLSTIDPKGEKNGTASLENLNFIYRYRIKNFLNSILMIILFYLILLIFSIRIDISNEHDLRKGFINYCKTILILEDVMKMLVKNPFYQINKFKSDVDSIIFNFKNFLVNLENINNTEYPFIIDDSFPNDLNNKNDIYKYYLQKKKIIFDIIFIFYDINKRNEFYIDYRVMYRIYKLSKIINTLVYGIENLNKLIKQDFKSNIDKDFKNYDYSDAIDVFDCGN